MPNKNKPGLGKGFGSLLPDDFDKSILLDKQDRIQKISVDSIKPDPNQPRKHFDQQSLNELSLSIKNYGLLQPLVVTPSGDNFLIIAGERRFRAAKLAGLKSLPALVRSSEELERLEIGLVENVQRVDLSPLEQAISIAKLNEQFNITYPEIAKRLGKAHTTIVNIVRLLKLPKSAAEALNKNQISEGHARTILSLADNPDAQEKLLKLITSEGLSVRKAEQFVSEYKNKPVRKDNKPRKTQKVSNSRIN